MIDVTRRRRTESAKAIRSSSGVTFNDGGSCGKGCTAWLVQLGRGTVGNSPLDTARAGLVAWVTGGLIAPIAASGELSKGVVGRVWAGREVRRDRAGPAVCVVEGIGVGAVHGLSTSPVKAGAFHRAMAVVLVLAWSLRGADATADAAVVITYGFRKGEQRSGNCAVAFSEWWCLPPEGPPFAMVVFLRTSGVAWSKALSLHVVVSRDCREDADVRYDGSLSSASPFGRGPAHAGGDRGDCRDV